MRNAVQLLIVLTLGCSDTREPPVEGANDALAMAACAAQSEAATALDAAPAADSAASAVIERDGAYAVRVDGVGFITLRSDIAHHDWAIFTAGEAALSSSALTLTGATSNGACPSADLQDHRVHIHEAADFVFRLDGQGTTWLYATREASGHGGGMHADAGHAHDAGHQHDTGHGHEADAGHEHDAGHEADAGHEHDAGHQHDAGHGSEHDAGHGHMH